MKMFRYLMPLFFVAALAAQPSTPATPSLPAGLPGAGPMKPVVSPAVDEHKLKNGLTVWMVQRPELPKVVFTLMARGGDSLDPATAPGLSRLMVKAMTQGTTQRSAREIAEAAQAAGGDIAAMAGSDAAQVSLAALSEHAGDALALVADVAQHANFPDKEVEIAKSNMQDELRASEARPGFLARRAWYQVTFGEHPYHIVSPTSQTLQAATPKSLRALYAQSFRPEQALLLVVGDFDKQQVIAQIEKNFGGWKAEGKAPAQVKEPTPKPDHNIYYVERPGSVQTTMLIGATGPTLRDYEQPYLRLANTIYGGSFGSRLIRNIREDKGYTYSPHSYTATMRFSGVVLTGEDVRNAVTGPSLKETFSELKRISSEPPSEAELQQAKRYLVGNTALELQSQSAVAGILGKYWVDGEPANHLTEEMATIQKAGLSEVSKAAARYLAPERMTVIAVGEKSVILEQLKPFGMQILPAPAP